MNFIGTYKHINICFNGRIYNIGDKTFNTLLDAQKYINKRYNRVNKSKGIPIFRISITDSIKIIKAKAYPTMTEGTEWIVVKESSGGKSHEYTCKVAGWYINNARNIMIAKNLIKLHGEYTTDFAILKSGLECLKAITSL